MCVICSAKYEWEWTEMNIIVKGQKIELKNEGREKCSMTEKQRMDENKTDKR